MQSFKLMTFQFQLFGIEIVNGFFFKGVGQTEAVLGGDWVNGQVMIDA